MKIACWIKRRMMFSVIYVLIIFVIARYCACLLPYYSPAAKCNEYLVAHKNDDTLRIGFIGDSWAVFYKQYGLGLSNYLEKRLLHPVEVRSSGVCGLTSKEIYYSMFNVDSIVNIIRWGPDYCVVMAGVNDSDRKLGVDYYKENMCLIIDFLLRNKIVPIVIEIPSYNIRQSFRIRKPVVRLLYLTSMMVNNSSIDCIDDYRIGLAHTIQEKQWEQRIIYIRVKDWNPLGYKDERNLYDGIQMHLNSKGYEVLNHHIAFSIMSDI